MTVVEELVLVPRPRYVEKVVAGPSSGTQLRRIQTDDIPPQGFKLSLTPAEMTMRYRDEAGLRYGEALFQQIRTQCPETLPGIIVKDWPDFPVRGYMLDVSRGRVPTRKTLERIVELLDLVRINHLQLYIEHTFQYRDHEDVWRDASPLTPDDIAWLDRICSSRGIELAANQNCFGHMEHWLKHEKYRDRAELPGGYELFGRHRPASTLQPTKDNADFALSLLRELLPHFTSRTVNIGCDETWELGRGRSRAEVERRGKGVVYIDHLRRLLEPLINQDYRPQFWGDIIAHHPELVDELPNGATAVAWTYEAPRGEGASLPWSEADARAFANAGIDTNLLTAGFKRTAEAYIEAEYPFWVAPGTSTWNSLIGRLDNAQGNLLDAALVGSASGAQGYLITEWGDNGHLQPPVVGFGPIVYGAAVSWCTETNADLDLVSVLNELVFVDTAKKIGGILDTIGRVWSRTGQQAFNASPLQSALTDRAQGILGEPNIGKVEGVIADLNQALSELESNTISCVDTQGVVAELTAAVKLARHGAYRLLTRAGGQLPPGTRLNDDLTAAINDHITAWDLRSRPGGREIGIQPLRATLTSYEP